MRQIKMGLTQVAILLGTVCGCLVCAFVVGYIGGQQVGFENALNSSVATLPRQAIETTVNADPAPAQVRQVYEKMDSAPESTASADNKVDDLPKLGAVKPVTDNPLVDDLVVDLLGETVVNEQEQLGDTKLVEAEKVEVMAKESTSDIVQPEVKVAEIDLVNQQAEQVKQEDLLSNNIANPTATPEQKMADTSGFLKAIIPTGWYVQTVAPTDLNEANLLAAKVRAAGFPVVIEKAVVNKQNYYRVLVGPEENNTLGERLLQQLRRENIIAGQPFLRMVR